MMRNNIKEFIPYRAITTMMDPGTRVMIFKDKDTKLWVAHGVEVSGCCQGADLEDLAYNWKIIAVGYKELSGKHAPRWEPPLGVEYESVWEAGTPCEFIDGLNARIVDENMYMVATKEYHKRYKSYGLGLSKEEQEEWDKINQ